MSFNSIFLPVPVKHEGQEGKQNFKEPILVNINIAIVGRRFQSW